jgi:hypothetical protein
MLYLYYKKVGLSMNDIYISTFQEFVDNCEVLKEQYTCLLVPFFNASAIRCWKEMIYSLKIPEWKRDLIWEALNDDISIEELKRIAQYTN